LNDNSRIGIFVRHSDLALAAAVVGILMVLVIPIPKFLIDILLTLNISVALLLLMVALSSARPLEFSTFPTLLLFTTLFRLSLNVATTRLILLRGDAGSVIEAFGQFVVGGNMVVGLVIFLILIVIQFVVITKGSGRISEVAARFTLDAMPGKQMAIDADLNSGLINEQQARERRERIAQEAEFYGAMDGASKFVRGDAIAGIVITAINLVGGMVLGKLRGMNMGDAVQTYSILTVGDGLVSQIPSLVISTTAGVIVTKASASRNLASDMAGQVLMNPRSILAASGILGFMGIIPGLPTAPFFILAALLLGVYLVVRHSRAETSARAAETQRADLEAPAEPVDPEREMADLIQVDRLAIEVGYQLIPLLDPNQNDEMLRKIKALRKQIAGKLGIVAPPVRIHDDLNLDPNVYVIRMGGNEIARGTVLADNLLAIDSGLVSEKLNGVEAVEPAFGLPAVWISPSQKDQAEAAGYTVADPRTIIITHLSEVIRKHAPELLSREDVRTLVDRLKEDTPTVVEELIPSVMSLGGVQKILENLLAEGIPINDLGSILEAIADHAQLTKDPFMLTELVRKSVARTICTSIKGRGQVGAITLDPRVEQLIAKAVQEAGNGQAMALEPGKSEQIIRRVADAVRDTVAAGFEAVLLTSGPIRRHVRSIVQNAIPELPVLAYDELMPEMELEGRATVALEEAPVM
jgi:flagellar biosynthesis protein FlhA